MSTINGMKTFMLLALMTALFVAVGFMIGGQQGMLIAFAIAAAMNLFAYWNSGSMVLRMYNAQEVGPGNAPDFHALVQQLAQRAGLPMPRVYLIDDPQPNAFATGRNPENAAVAATTGLLRALSREEIAGVMAHELAHVKNRDTLTMTVTATIAGAIGMLAQFGGLFGGRDSEGRPSNPLLGIVVMILAPIAAMLVQMWISRTREYEADALGAEICGDPTWLAGALTKIEQIAQGVANPTAEANPATAHMFIVNPLHVQAVDGMFRTHPRTRDRVERLLAMAQGMRRAAPARPTVQRGGTFSAYGPRGNRRGPWG